MKYSFVIPYYKRPSFRNTLMSFVHFYKDRQDYQVVLIEDKKNKGDLAAHAKLSNIVLEFSGRIAVKHLVSSYDNYACPCSMINWGVDESDSTYVIMTNPECVHVTNILQGFDDEFLKNNDVYVIAACENGGVLRDAVHSFTEFEYKHLKWYQHSVHHNRMLNWCTCLSKSNFISVGGFNEEFDKGLGRADVSFMKAITRKIRPIVRDDLVCVHQSHSREHQFTAERRNLIHNNGSCKLFKSRFKQ